MPRISTLRCAVGIVLQRPCTPLLYGRVQPRQLAARANSTYGAPELNTPWLPPQLDATKSAVVFQRYYHLFTREELRGLAEEALVLGPAGEGRGEGIGEGEGDGGRRDGAGQGPRRGPCGVVEEVYYDKSNWCVVFRRDR